MIERKAYISQLCKWKDKQVIKVVTGIRRCGKSSLLKMYREKLLHEGVLPAQVQDINFESLDNEPFLDYKVLYAHIKANLCHDKMNYLFFDEIQMVNNFQKVIDSLFLLDNVDIYVTGSNAYLLSGEIATLLTGRYIEIKLFPFSFKEFLLAQSENTSLENAYRKYIELGSFPYISQIDKNPEMVKEYLLGLYNTIVLNDVVARKKITDTMMLQSIVRFLADNIGNISVIKRISDTLTSLGRKTTSHTVENYVAALIDSFIFYPVQRFDIKGKELLKTGLKLYLADVGLRQVINGSKGSDLGHILENIVFLELARRGGEIFVGKAANAEIDFVVINGDHKAYYQVSLSVRDSATMQRELAPLLSISDNFPKYLLTLDNDPVIYHNGIKQLYVLDWLTKD
ncbi:MAG: ATP-binding protein [Muribaculaceae bacterium]|nr:ATP-binding protein [Muribaculaceae bacterium]